MALIIIQDPGPGDLILPTHPISDGDSDGVIVRVGFRAVLDSDMAMVMVNMVTGAVAGGVLPSITPHVGVAGMVVPDLMDFTEAISMCVTIFK